MSEELEKCHKCEGQGWTQESEHETDCSPYTGCVEGCPVPVQEKCFECGGNGIGWRKEISRLGAENQDHGVKLEQLRDDRERLKAENETLREEIKKLEEKNRRLNFENSRGLYTPENEAYMKRLEAELAAEKEKAGRVKAAINKCLDHWALVAGPSAYELSGMRVLLEKSLIETEEK